MSYTVLTHETLHARQGTEDETLPCIFFPLVLSDTRHPPAHGLGERSPLFHSLQACAGMQTLKNGPPTNHSDF